VIRPLGAFHRREHLSLIGWLERIVSVGELAEATGSGLTRHGLAAWPDYLSGAHAEVNSAERTMRHKSAVLSRSVAVDLGSMDVVGSSNKDSTNRRVGVDSLDAIFYWNKPPRDVLQVAV